MGMLPGTFAAVFTLWLFVCAGPLASSTSYPKGIKGEPGSKGYMGVGFQGHKTFF